jgi:hypothetical protein
MIAELDDGTELYFPDDMDDAEVDRRVEQFVSRTSAKDAIEAMRVSIVNELRKGFAAVIEAELRPRELVRDAMGRPQRAKPVAKAKA